VKFPTMDASRMRGQEKWKSAGDTPNRVIECNGGDMGCQLHTMESAKSQAEGPIWAFLLGRCGIIVVSHKQQPKCVAHSSVDQSIEGTEQ